MKNQLGRHNAEAIRQILTRHAQRGPSGYPSRCQPPDPHAQRKVIFRTEEAATAAERELVEKAGALHQTVYHCRYADHWHLTKWRLGDP